MLCSCLGKKQKFLSLNNHSYNWSLALNCLAAFGNSIELQATLDISSYQKEKKMLQSFLSTLNRVRKQTGKKKPSIRNSYEFYVLVYENPKRKSACKDEVKTVLQL